MSTSNNSTVIDKSNENMTTITDYKTYCEELYKNYNNKHHEFLKYYEVINQLFHILEQLEANNPIDFNELLSNWNLDVSKEKQVQENLGKNIAELKTKFNLMVKSGKN